MCLGGGTLAEINEKAVNAAAQIFACGPSHFRRCLGSVTEGSSGIGCNVENIFPFSTSRVGIDLAMTVLRPQNPNLKSSQESTRVRLQVGN